MERANRLKRLSGMMFPLRRQGAKLRGFAGLVSVVGAGVFTGIAVAFFYLFRRAVPRLAFEFFRFLTAFFVTAHFLSPFFEAVLVSKRELITVLHNRAAPGARL